MNVDAIGALRRGFLNVRANWQLLPMQWLFGVLFFLLLVLSLVPLVVAIGWSVFQDLPAQPDQWLGWLEQLPQILLARAFPILLGVLVSLAIGVVAVWVYGYLLAGTYGVLAVGEALAPSIQPPPPIRAGSTLSWRQFVAFEWSAFHAAGLARVWTYFWMIHLFITLGLLLVLFWALLILGAVTAFQGYGGFAAFGIGCGGALPLFFLGVILSFWTQMAMIEASRDGATVLGAARAGFELLGKRFGAVLLLFLLQIVAGMVVGAVFLPMAVISQLAAGDSAMLSLTLRFPLSLIQWLASSALQLVFMAAYLALAHDRRPFTAAFPRPGAETTRDNFDAAPYAVASATTAGAIGAAGALAFDRVADDAMPSVEATTEPVQELGVSDALGRDAAGGFEAPSEPAGADFDGSFPSDSSGSSDPGSSSSE